MTWTAPLPTPVDGPLTGADRPLLEGHLAWQRSTLLAICGGLTGEQLALRPIPSTSLSLLGLVRHLAKVERIWLSSRVARLDLPPVFPLGTDVDFDGGTAGDAEGAVAALVREWAAGDEAVRDIGFDEELTVHGETWSLRMVYVHLIGEYARHNGHADLLREAVDGVTGR